MEHQRKVFRGFWVPFLVSIFFGAMIAILGLKLNTLYAKTKDFATVLSADNLPMGIKDALEQKIHAKNIASPHAPMEDNQFATFEIKDWKQESVSFASSVYLRQHANITLFCPQDSEAHELSLFPVAKEVWSHQTQHTSLPDESPLQGIDSSSIYDESLNEEMASALFDWLIHAYKEHC